MGLGLPKGNPPPVSPEHSGWQPQGSRLLGPGSLLNRGIHGGFGRHRQTLTPPGMQQLTAIGGTYDGPPALPPGYHAAENPGQLPAQTYAPTDAVGGYVGRLAERLRA